MAPGSAVSVIRSAIFSSAATEATPSGIPKPRFTTLFGRSSMAARRAMILRAFSGIGVRPCWRAAGVPWNTAIREFNEIFARLPSHRDRALVAFYVSTGARASEPLSVVQGGAHPGR